jgi:uncharacterized membrane protein
VVTARRGRLVHGVDVDRVEAAIRAAERLTSGEIRVAISRFYFWGDVERAAAGAFARLRMEKTRLRNGVLVFVAPRLRRFALRGDVGVAERVGDDFWRRVARDFGADCRSGDLTQALERAVQAVGSELARQFPADAVAANELPDQVDAAPRG